MVIKRDEKNTLFIFELSLRQKNLIKEPGPANQYIPVSTLFCIQSCVNIF